MDWRKQEQWSQQEESKFLYLNAKLIDLKFDPAKLY